MFPSVTNDDAHYCTGWLFLFAVLMAAGLLFTMVFFVRLGSSSPTTCLTERFGTPDHHVF